MAARALPDSNPIAARLSTGRASGHWRGLTARTRDFTPGGQRPGHLTGTIRRDLKLMNIHTAENYEAAQEIIKALALPTASGAPVAPRPLPLSHLPRLPSETSMGVRHGACRSFWEGHEPRNHRCLAVAARRPARDDPHPQRRRPLPFPDGLLRVPRRPCIAISVTARRLLSVTPGDELLLAAAVEFPLIADYIPLVEKAVTKGTRRVYGPYWARVVREWGYRRVNEPTALEISQLAEQVRAGAVQRRNARGGRGAAEHLIGALLARRDPETQTISLVLDDTTANVALFAIAAHADEREAHIREVERSGQNLPEGSYGRRNRQAIAARETRVAARLRTVEQAYRTATEHDTASRPPEPTRTFRSPERQADREMELE